VSELREELAVATRMLVALGIMEYSGHLSARQPEGDRFLIQPGNDSRAKLRPERLLTVDLDGRVIEGDAKAPSEVAIHGEIYRERPDVGAVAHFHHDPTTMFTMVGDRPLVAVKNHAARWSAGVPVYPHPWHVDSPDKGKALAHTLGGGHALLLRAHGEVVVAEDVKALFADVVHFVENADALARAHALGPVTPLGEEECARFLQSFDRASHARKLWAYYTTVYGPEP
jgi:L-ribulose-5-phosphate 4-epimerase